MADGSIGQDSTRAPDYQERATVLIGLNHVLQLGVPSLTYDPPGLREVAKELGLLAEAALRNAVCRGDDDTDRPGTLQRAIEGAHVLLQLSLGVHDAADALSAKGVGHG